MVLDQPMLKQGWGIESMFTKLHEVSENCSETESNLFTCRSLLRWFTSLNECLLKFLGKQFPLACIVRHGESWGLFEGLILILRMFYGDADINQELEVPSLLWIKILAHTEGILVFWLRILELSRTHLLRLLKLFPLHLTHILNSSTSCLSPLSSFLFSLSEILCMHLSACLLGTKNSFHNRDFLSFPMTYPTSDDVWAFMNDQHMFVTLTNR